MHLELASFPVESTRIIHVRDVLEARLKVDPPGAVLPGILGPPYGAGHGRTHRLAGLAIVQSGQFPEPGALRMLRDSIIDLSGVAAELVPFSKLINLVVTFEFETGVGNVEAD